MYTYISIIPISIIITPNPHIIIIITTILIIIILLIIIIIILIMIISKPGTGAAFLSNAPKGNGIRAKGS